ncbi:LysR family transcriptional regulator [Burkholderia pyrrocinia]|uniref:LysR family transcriptional regulator n=1 Tax=Burkholderia pyrrocinia TaxID=60550 RepID=UPI0015751C23|nr:LysR family transcriptional regulator [Burkholderia pyrrocinia]
MCSTDTQLLRDFLALTATGNFTRAAELRHVSQAAFSRRIQALESWAGVPLVERGSIPSRPTDAGQRLRVTAAETVAKLPGAKADLSGAALRQQEHIRVGINSLPALNGALSGFGIALLPDYVANHAIQGGSLVCLSQQSWTTARAYYLRWPR